MKARLLFRLLFALNVLIVIITSDASDGHFDFNSNGNYYKVNIATNKPTVLPVTLYNPHIWPGPNDTHSTTTAAPLPSPKAQRRRFVFGQRRSVTEDKRNTGFGYDNDLWHNVTVPSIQPTISPFNKKFYTFDPSIFMNDTNHYWQNTSRQYPISPEFPRRILIPRNYSFVSPYERNYSEYSPNNVRKVIRRIPVQNRNVTKSAPRWQIFVTEPPRLNFSRDIGDFQDAVVNEFADSRNFSTNQILVPNRTVITTHFSCGQMNYYGYYADIESNCKLFHICTPDGRTASFLCPEHLRFNQLLTVCDWKERVFCDGSVTFYNTNLDKFPNWNGHLLGKK